MQNCLFACPGWLLSIRFGVPAEPVGETERKRTFSLLLLFGSCLIAHESPNEHWPFMVQRMQFPFSVRLSFARNSYCKSHLEMRTLHFLFKMSLANHLQSVNRISCRRMSPLVCRLVTHIPTDSFLNLHPALTLQYVVNDCWHYFVPLCVENSNAVAVYWNIR